MFQIDDEFIKSWHPKYDLTENDEAEYRRLVAQVAREMASVHTIKRETFLAIWNWKGAMRVIGHVLLDQYTSLYAEAFRRIPLLPPVAKLPSLLAGISKLPGFGAPTASTVVHFIHPDLMPIIDVRTATVLAKAAEVSTDRTDLEHYEEFRRGIDAIRRRCPRWTLREIDRALFAYHKQYFDMAPSRQGCTTAFSPRTMPREIVGRSLNAALSTNHNRFAQVFKSRIGSTFTTPQITKIMLAECDIQAGSILPNDHGEGNKAGCPRFAHVVWALTWAEEDSNQNGSRAIRKCREARVDFRHSHFLQEWWKFPATSPTVLSGGNVGTSDRRDVHQFHSSKN